MRIRTQTPLPSQIEQLCTSWGFWSPSQLYEALNNPGYLLIYIDEEDRQGQVSYLHACILVRIAPCSTDIMFIYVDPNHRGKGYGIALLQELWQNLGQRKEQEGLFLEARTSNYFAIKVYYQFGMSKIATRKKYYQDGEDALVFYRPIPKLRQEK